MSWPHAPKHFINEQCLYMVTAGTYLKSHFFKEEERLNILQDNLLSLSKEFEWELHAWAIFSNHYHFIAKPLKNPSNLRTWIAKLHQSTSSFINKKDGEIGRKVWFQFWDSKITFHSSYLARLNYVHQNPVKHGIVSKASRYRWCSAHEFETHANRSFANSVYSFDYSKVKVFDEF